MRGKIKQNLFWATLAMSASTITVTLNALLLNRVRFREATSQSLQP